MSAWLAHPLVQSAVAPFAVAFIVAWLLRPHGGILAGIGFAIAYGVAVYLIMGFQWTPLTSTRKLVLAGGGAVIAGIGIDLFMRGRAARYWLLALGGAVAALWLIWPLLTRKEGSELALFIALSLGYSAWLLAGLEGLNSRPVHMVAAALALSVGTAISALLGASALLGQLGGAVAAAVGGYGLVFLISGEFEPRSIFSAPVAISSALIGVSAMAYARLPSTALVALAVIPVLAQLPAPKNWGVLQRGLLVMLYTLPAAAVLIHSPTSRRKS